MLTHQGAVVKDVKFKRIAQITILFCLNKPKIARIRLFLLASARTVQTECNEACFNC